MPLLLKRLAIGVALPTAVALGVSASAAPPTPVTDLYTLVSGNDWEPWCGEDDRSNVKAADADLRGPHFTLTLECLFQASAVPADQASLSAELGALAPAAPGSEFLFVQFATQADYLADFSHDGLAATAWIEVGTERIELSEPPDNADFLVASVPVGEPAVLWVDDMGRAQGLDLRTGERIDPVAAYYGELGFWTDELEGFEYLDVRFVGDGGWWWTAGCHDRIVELTRSAWTADRGWAPEGSVYLSFQFRWCDASYQDVIWTLDTDRALLLEAAGEYRVPDGWASEPYVGTPGSTTYTAVFEVPADVADFHLVFVPAGELVEKDSGEVFLQETMPAITEWAVSF